MSNPRWQPVVLVLHDGQRLECKCGALAIFVSGKVADDQYNSMDEVDVWCQACFEQAQEREEDV